MVIPFIQCMVGRRTQTRVRPPGDAWMEETPILTEDIPVGIVLEGVDIIGESLVKKKKCTTGACRCVHGGYRQPKREGGGKCMIRTCGQSRGEIQQ